MCDASYLCQVERLEREVLAQVALLPHLDEDARKQVASVDEVRAEFDAWLVEDSADEAAMTPEERERLVLFRLLGVAKGR